MYGPVMFYKPHAKFKTVTVNDVYLKKNFKIFTSSVIVVYPR